jgi:hypothetical protein
VWVNLKKIKQIKKQTKLIHLSRGLEYYYLPLNLWTRSIHGVVRGEKRKEKEKEKEAEGKERK